MGRTKTSIKASDLQSLESLMQETYYDACSVMQDAQNNINRLKRGSDPETVDDHTKIAKEITSALKVKESSAKIKLEIVKLQHDIIKSGKPVEEIEKQVSASKADPRNLQQIRDLISAKKKG